MLHQDLQEKKKNVWHGIYVFTTPTLSINFFAPCHPSREMSIETFHNLGNMWSNSCNWKKNAPREVYRPIAAVVRLVNMLSRVAIQKNELRRV